MKKTGAKAKPPRRPPAAQTKKTQAKKPAATGRKRKRVDDLRTDEKKASADGGDSSSGSDDEGGSDPEPDLPSDAELDSSSSEEDERPPPKKRPATADSDEEEDDDDDDDDDGDASSSSGEEAESDEDETAEPATAESKIEALRRVGDRALFGSAAARGAGGGGGGNKPATEEERQRRQREKDAEDDRLAAYSSDLDRESDDAESEPDEEPVATGDEADHERKSATDAKSAAPASASSASSSASSTAVKDHAKAAANGNEKVKKGDAKDAKAAGKDEKAPKNEEKEEKGEGAAKRGGKKAEGGATGSGASGKKPRVAKLQLRLSFMIGKRETLYYLQSPKHRGTILENVQRMLERRGYAVGRIAELERKSPYIVANRDGFLCQAPIVAAREGAPSVYVMLFTTLGVPALANIKWPGAHVILLTDNICRSKKFRLGLADPANKFQGQKVRLEMYSSAQFMFDLAVTHYQKQVQVLTTPLKPAATPVEFKDKPELRAEWSRMVVAREAPLLPSDFTAQYYDLKAGESYAIRRQSAVAGFVDYPRNVRARL